MRDYRTYAIRLAVEGGGQVKAELVSVGQSGEQSLKRIESAGDRASGGLKGLGRQAELLRTGIRTLGGALIGAATVGGLGALIDRSISAADAIGKTADKIGVGVEALQELRFAAKASGVEQHTLDMALQRFTRRAAEAAQGTGEAKDALAQMGIALRDQSGNLRRSEDLLGDVADAFAGIEDPAELDTLSQVISANLTRAALEAAPVIAELSSWLADVAGKAGIAWERLFDAPEEKSLRTLRYELDLASSTIEKLEGRIQELRESPTLGFHDLHRHGADQRAGAQARRAAPRPRSDPGPDRVPRRAAGHRRAGSGSSAGRRRYRWRAGPREKTWSGSHASSRARS